MDGDILTREQRKSRKEHRCCLCGETIVKGAEYIYISYIFDGHIYTDKLHIHCDAMWDAWIARHGNGGEYTHEEVLEGILEDICEQICDENQLMKCSMTTSLSCELCQRKLLDPGILESAIQSVRDNGINL